MRHPIKNYEGIYELDDQDLKVYNVITNKPLKPQLNTHGYPTVHLYKNKIGKTTSLHRIVAETLIPNPDNLPVVMHLDNDKTNYHPDNLKFGYQRENVNNALLDKITRVPAPELRKSGYVLVDGIHVVPCFGLKDVANKIGKTKKAAEGYCYRGTVIKNGPYKGYHVKKCDVITKIEHKMLYVDENKKVINTNV